MSQAHKEMEGAALSNITYWMEAVHAQPDQCYLAQPQLADITSIRFIGNIKEFSPDTLYLGSAEAVRQLLDSPAFPHISGITFFASGFLSGLPQLAASRGANVVCTEEDLFSLHNLLDEQVQKYRSWSIRFHELSNPGHPIQDVVDEAARITGFSIFLLNTADRVIFKHVNPQIQAPAILALQENGFLTPDLKTLLTDPNGSSRVMLKELGDDSICWIYKVYKQGTAISNMIFAAPASARRFDTYTVMELTRSAIHRLMRESQDLSYWAGEEFKILLKEIVETRITDKQEIDARFSKISCGSGIFCSFIIIAFEKQEILRKNATQILTELEELFPDTNVAIYDECIVLLLARPNRAFQPRPIFDTEGFSRLLAGYQAHAAISNATSRRGLLRTQYILTKQVLDLGHKLFPAGRERILYFEDFAEYLMIELAINSFKNQFGHDDIVLLIHPDAVKLIKYDRDHHSDLMKFVYHYCLCNCNIVQTAKNAYMHRNTAANRLTKVHELINADLSSGEVQQRMIFSYKVYHYYRHCSAMSLEERMERL